MHYKHTRGESQSRRKSIREADTKAAFGGDLLWRNTMPNLIDASTKVWIDTLDTLAKNFPDYTFVPGHGDLGNVQDIVAFRDYLATLRRLVADAQARQKSGAALAESVMPMLAEKYGQWDFFKFLAQANILDTDAELRGTKRIPF